MKQIAVEAGRAWCRLLESQDAGSLLARRSSGQDRNRGVNWSRLGRVTLGRFGVVALLRFVVVALLRFVVVALLRFVVVSVVVLVILLTVAVVRVGPLDLSAETPVLGLLVARGVMVGVAALVPELVLVVAGYVGVLEVTVVVLIVAFKRHVVSQDVGQRGRNHQTLNNRQSQSVVTSFE